MKTIILFITLLSSVCFADVNPATGVIASLPIHDGGGGKFITIENLVFTNKRLTRPTLFSSFQQQESDTYNVACCVEVADLAPISLDELKNKYSTDIVFTNIVNNIKGHQFIYRSRFQKKNQNAWQKLLIESQNEDAIPYVMPAIEGVVMQNTIKNTFTIGKTIITIDTPRANSKHSVDIYTFTVNGKKTTFTTPLQTGG
ncbi:hypothetical protein [Chitinolyticbacter albus]|uniref:hypothetical protein n=1 Tax=Chitinolyticbacter albus TaxID=2961951 RepID=UPI00210A92CF|nr:hypothetical protein [Chitinolyticbacter albus]